MAAIAPEPGGLAEVTSRKAAIDVVGQFAWRIANLLLGVVVTVLIVRALGEKAFGQWSAIFAVTQIVSVFGDLGLEQVAVRRAAAEPAAEGRWLGSLITLRLAIAVPLGIAQLAVLLALSQTAAMRIASLILGGLIPLSALVAYRAVFQLRVQNRLTASLELLNGLVWAAGVVLVAALGGGLVAFAIAFGVAALASTVPLVVLASRAAQVQLRGSRQGWGELWRVGVPVAVGTVLVVSYGRIDQVLVFEVLGDRAAGLYGAAYRVLDRGMVVPATVLTTLFPLIAAAHGVDPVRVRQLVQLGAEIVATVAFPVLPVVAVTAAPLAQLLFGADFRDAGAAFAILMGLFAVSGFGYLASYLVLILRRQRWFLRVAALALVVNVVLNLLLLRPLGFEAAAVVTLVTEALVITWTLSTVFPGIGLRLRLGRLARITAASLLAGGAAEAVERAAWGLGVALVAAGVVYVAALWALRAWTLAELRAVAAREV